MNRKECSEHCRRRFRERVTKKTKRVEEFVTKAYYLGKSLNEVTNADLRYFLENKQKVYGSIARVYNGYILWFVNGIAARVYPVPQELR